MDRRASNCSKCFFNHNKPQNCSISNVSINAQPAGLGATRRTDDAVRADQRFIQ